VHGSTTTPDKLERLETAGARPHRIVVGEEVEGEGLDAFFGTDVLVFCVPPSSDGPAYPERAKAVRRAAEAGGIGWVVMTSSTSVYPDLDAVVTESDAGAREGMPLRRNGPDVLAAERVLWGSTAFDTTILRLAGLYGYGRHPAHYFAGKRDLQGGEAPVNLVHRDDVIGVIETVLEQDARGVTFNVCADHHPTRRRIYPVAAERLGIDPPSFDGVEAEGYKIVSNRKVRERLGYAFAYPDPMTPAP
jgi:nucleoside-diphosphate-sugar epimerase